MTKEPNLCLQARSEEPTSTEHYFPLVYEQLRHLASARLARESPGQTLQATALVHEAFLRIMGSEPQPSWQNRGHFFAAAAEAMRRILIDRARQKASQKRGGHRQRLELESVEPEIIGSEFSVIELDNSIEQLSAIDSRAAAVVKLRFFAGLTVRQVSETLNVSISTVENDWAYARSWLRVQLATNDICIR